MDWEETDDLAAVAAEVDVLYQTRIQKERFQVGLHAAPDGLNAHIRQSPSACYSEAPGLVNIGVGELSQSCWHSLCQADNAFI